MGASAVCSVTFRPPANTTSRPSTSRSRSDLIGVAEDVVEALPGARGDLDDGGVGRVQCHLPAPRQHHLPTIYLAQQVAGALREVVDHVQLEGLGGADGDALAHRLLG